MGPDTSAQHKFLGYERQMTRRLDYRDSVLKAYAEVYTPAALEALEVLAPLNRDQHELMARRIARRLTRERCRQRIAFLDPQALLPPTGIRGLDDRHVGEKDGSGFSASIIDVALYVVNNHQRLRDSGASIVLYLPKIQTAEEAALWNDLLAALEQHLGLPIGTIKVYVLVEQIEASFQLMEIRAVLGRHFVGFNTGRWDYINSVADAMVWDPGFVNPNIDAIGMTYGYLRNYEDRGRRTLNTPDRNGRRALSQGGIEPNIPVGSAAGVAAGMRRAKAGGKREQLAGASGKWVAHRKMVHIVRPAWV